MGSVIIKTKRITMLFLVVLFFVAAGEALVEGEMMEEETRVLHFPKDRSLGTIKVLDANIKRQIQTSHIDSWDSIGWHDWSDWTKAEYFGEAQGGVVIPAGKKVGLFLSKDAIKDLSPLLNLKPDDLYMLSHMPLNWNEDPILSAKCMQYIAHLAGLKSLRLFGTRTTTEGMKHIIKLQSLEMLQPPKGLTNRGLSYVAKLESLKRLYFTENKITNAGLKRYIPKLTNLEELWLGQGRISDAGLVCLAELPMLRYLSIRYGNFTDAGMAHVKKCSSLRILDLISVPITDAGVYHLSSLDKLENLNLSYTEVTDRGLVYLKSMPSLKKLKIGKRNIDRDNPPITDAGMVHLAQINSLEYLDLPYHGITGKGLATIANLKNLKHLWVGCYTSSPLTDKALSHVSKFEKLEYLHIGGTDFTDAGMVHLSKLKKLKVLHFTTAPRVTDKGLAELKSLKQLERLSLRSKKVTISGLSHLNAFKNLTDLEVGRFEQDNSGLDISGLIKLERLNFELFRKGSDSVRDEDLACLVKLKNLRRLVIGGVKSSTVTDAGIAHLKDLPNMRELFCGSPYLTDKSLSYLANMKTLYSLTITGNFTDEGLGFLEELKALHHLKIYSSNNFSPKAKERLLNNLPNMRPSSFTAEQDREIKKISKNNPNPSKTEKFKKLLN